MHWKYHPESGAYEHIPTPEIIEMKQLKDENKKLLSDKEELEDRYNQLLDLLTKKKVISAKEAKDLNSTEN